MINRPLPEKIFARRLVLAFVFTVMMTTLFNFLVNPFGLFPVGTLPGLNDIRRIDNVRLYKTFHVHRHPVEGLMLGSSRTEEGMRPLPAAWGDLEVYNMAMPGVMIREMHRNLQHANRNRSIQQVLVGLDFFMFSAFQEDVVEFSEDHFAVDQEGNPRPATYALRTYANVLFSADGLAKSWKTLVHSHRRDAPSHEESGMTTEASAYSKLRSDRDIIRSFETFQKSYFRKGGNWLNGPGATYTTENRLTGESTWKDFEGLLRYIYSEKIGGALVISPVHVRLLLGIEDIGLQPQFFEWKRQAARINERVAAEYGREPLPLWDFSLVNAHTTEALPDMGLPKEQRKQKMQWFWDPAHYKPVFGDLIQQRVFVTLTEDETGAKITTSGVESHLEAQRQALLHYRQQDPETSEEVRDFVKRLNVYQWIEPAAL